MTAVIIQVGILGIIMAIGFIVAKTGYIDVKIKDSISKLIVNLILPCLIISSISSKEISREMLGDLGITFLLTIFCIAVFFMLGVLTAKLLKIPDFTAKTHKLLSTLGNVIFLGYPIVVSMYGEEGFIYAIIYWLINDLFLWTVGVLMLSEEKSGNKKALFKKLLNPNTISFGIALLMLALKIKLPPVLDSAVESIGSLTTPLSMIFIGMTLATVNIKNALKKWWIFIAAPIKMILMPIAFIYLFKLFGIKEIILGVVVLEAAMPAQTVLSILANEHKADSEYAAVGMFVTTVASLLTLPFICYLLRLWV